MNILNGNEAFSALMAGKKILCRAVGELMEFDDLDQFPATIFAKPGYEFSIKIDSIELAGITFTKPLTLDEYQDGKDVFVICTYGPSVYAVNFKTSALVESINSGFVQRDAENAKLQLQAMCKSFGRELDGDCLVVRLGEESVKPEKKRQSRKKTADTSVAIADVEPSGKESADLPWVADEVPADVVVAIIDTVDDLYASFEYQISQTTTHKDLIQIRATFSANGTLSDEQHEHLNAYFNERLAELDPEQYTPKIEIISQENVTTSEDSLINETVEQGEPDPEHQKHLDAILDAVNNAQTPIGVNAHIRYTKSWTEEQRKPVIQAMNKRLIELNDQKEVATEPPSLMVQIQNAPDLTALDVLEIDVASRHPDIQPKLMDLVKKRRFELVNQSSQVAS